MERLAGAGGWVTVRSQEGQESQAARARGWEEGTAAKGGRLRTEARSAVLMGLVWASKLPSQKQVFSKTDS